MKKLLTHIIPLGALIALFLILLVGTRSMFGMMRADHVHHAIFTGFAYGGAFNAVVFGLIGYLLWAGRKPTS